MIQMVQVKEPGSKQFAFVPYRYIPKSQTFPGNW